MPIRLKEETEKYLLGSIKRFFSEELEQDIGDLKAMLVLDFFVREMGPSVYNQAIADAQAFIGEKVSDMGDARYEIEFAFWNKR